MLLTRRALTPAMASSSASTCSFLEEGISAIDEECVARVVAARVADQVDRDRAEILRLAPAAYRNPRQHPVAEFVPVERLLGHRRIDPARQDGVGADAATREFHRQRADHRDQAALGRRVMLAARLPGNRSEARGA